MVNVLYKVMMGYDDLIDSVGVPNSILSISCVRS